MYSADVWVLVGAQRPNGRTRSAFTRSPDIDRQAHACDAAWGAGFGRKLAACLPVVLACLLTASTPILALDTIEVLAEDAAPPWSLPDGTGYANDVVCAAFRAAGVDASLRVMPYARCKEMTVRGEAAACFSMSWLPEFEGKIVFSAKPLFTYTSDYFCNTGKPLKARREEEITETIRVGIVAGYEYPLSLYQLRDRGLARLESARSEALNLKKLAAGRLDAVLLNYNEYKTASNMMAEAGVTGKVVRAFPCGTFGSFIGFSVAHPNGAWAKRQFDEGLASIQADGTLAALQTRWVDRAKAALSKAQAAPPKGEPK